MSSLANSTVEANEVAARGTGRDEEKEARQKQYKNVGKHEELRRRRNECSVEIRKQKGQDLLMKRRNLVADDEEDDGAETSETSDVDTPVKGAASVRMSCPEIKRMLMNNPNADQMRHCFESLRRMLSRSENPPIEEVIKEGLLDACIQALQINDDKLRYEACWSLTNIVSGTSEQTWAAVKAGATQHLVNLSVHPSLNVAEQALWAVANIAGDSSQLRDLVIECRGLEAMLEIARHIDSIPLSFARTLSWAFSNICRHKNPSASLEALRLICQALPSLLNYSDKQVRHDALWAVSYLTDGNDEQISLSVSSGVIDIIFSTLQSSDTQLIAPSLRALGNVCTGNDDLTQYVINLGLLKEIIPLVERVKSTVTMKESTWLLSNILAGTQDQIQAVINAGLLPYLKEVLKSGDYKCQYEAIWALANIATGGTSQQILSMVHEGIVTELSLMLSMKSSEIVCLTLETIYTCLCNVANLTPDVMDTLKDSIEEMGALDKLEELQNSDNDKIYQNAYRIISEFFSDEDGVPADDAGDENQPPTQQYNF